MAPPLALGTDDSQVATTSAETMEEDIPSWLPAGTKWMIEKKVLLLLHGMHERLLLPLYKVAEERRARLGRQGLRSINTWGR